MVFITRASLLSALILFPAMAPAQNYPNKPIRIFASKAGGGIDVLLRLLAQGLAPSLGEQILIENRPAGVIPISAVARAAPDGHVLLGYTNALWTAPLLQSVPYDTVRDFAPVSTIARAPNVLVVHSSVAVNSIVDLISLARSKPGVLNYGSSSSGSANHLASELFKFTAGVDIVRVPYKGSGPLLNALLGGQVQMAFLAGGPVAPHIKSGKLRGLGVASAQPSELVPGLPTVSGSENRDSLSTHASRAWLAGLRTKLEP